MVPEFTLKEHPVQNYPYRQPLALVDHLEKYISDKSVCDLGCACGDILFEMQKYAKSVVGIEIDTRYRDHLTHSNITRPFIIWGNALDVEMPQCDVYYIWMSSDRKLNHDIVDRLPQGALLVDATTRLDLFDDHPALELVEVIHYNYDERLNDNDHDVVRGVSFPMIGVNRLRIFKKNG